MEGQGTPEKKKKSQIADSERKTCGSTSIKNILQRKRSSSWLLKKNSAGVENKILGKSLTYNIVYCFFFTLLHFYKYSYFIDNKKGFFQKSVRRSLVPEALRPSLNNNIIIYKI